MEGRDTERRERDITAAPAPQPPAQQQQTTTATNQTTFSNCQFKILAGKQKQYLFPEIVPRKNRRFLPHERELENIVSKVFRRPPRHFFYDNPTYPYCVPEPRVNFKLNFTE
nr:MAG: hypothetical protein [Betatorquevirus sp.]